MSKIITQCYEILIDIFLMGVYNLCNGFLYARKLLRNFAAALRKKAAEPLSCEVHTTPCVLALKEKCLC